MKELPLNFKCKYTWEDGRSETWSGKIVSLRNYGKYCEIEILSRSSLNLIFGKYSNGFFACAPSYGGTYLSYRLDDIFYNTERMAKVFDNIVDGATAAKAIATAALEVNF